MKTGLFTLVSTEHLTPKVALLHFSGNTDAISVPGQFVTVSLPGFFLHRPFSVLDWGPGWLELMVEQVGPVTAQLQHLAVGSTLEITTGLGNGFSLKDSGKAPLLIGGGSGIAPLLGLAKRLFDSGAAFSTVLGFRSAEDVCCVERFESCSGSLKVYTEDGTAGQKGRVTDAKVLQRCSMFYACGPKAMLQAVCQITDAPGELSLDVRMGCGFGACMGCSIRTVSGMRRVCKDGPVFRKEDLLWEV